MTGLLFGDTAANGVDQLIKGGRGFYIVHVSIIYVSSITFTEIISHNNSLILK